MIKCTDKMIFYGICFEIIRIEAESGDKERRVELD